MKRCLLIAFISVIWIQAFSQYQLKGKVINATNSEAVAGATVAIQGTFLVAVTDDKGGFAFRNLKEATLDLSVTSMGYEPETRVVEAKKNEELIFSLKPKAILAEEVEIRATRAGEKTPTTYQNVNLSRMQGNNMGQDLPFLLSDCISTVSSSDAGNGVGYTALRIRGTDMTRINVTINGIPLNDPESHNVFWVDLPDFAASTDNIQIQRGVGTSTNGAAAFGASVNLQSNPVKQDAYGTISGSYGSFNTWKSSVSFGSGLLSKHWSLDGRISKIHSDGYIDRAKSDLDSYFLSGTYSDNRNILRLNVFSGKERTYQAWDGIPHEILDTNRTFNGMGAYTDSHGVQKYYKDEVDSYAQNHFQALYSHQFGRSLYLNAALHYTAGAGYYEQYREDDELADYGISPVRLPGPWYIIGQDTVSVPDSLIQSSDLIRRKWLDNDFAGLTYSLNWNKEKVQLSLGGSWNTYTGRHFGKVIWAQFAGDSEMDHEWYRSKAKKDDFNLYGKANYDITRHLSLFADLQLRKIKYGIDGIDDDSRNIGQDHDFTFFNPKAGLFVNINNSNSAYLSFAVASREPNRDNFVDANPALPAPKPETLYDIEIGQQLNHDKFSLHSNLYYMYYHDQLVLTGAINDVGAPVMENVPESYRMGLEFSSQVYLSSSIVWNLHATLSRNKIVSYTEYIDNWDTWEQDAVKHSDTDIAFSPSVIAGNEIRWNLVKNGFISLNSRYVGKQYIDNTQDDSRSLHAYLLHDIRMSYSFAIQGLKSLELNLQLNNILNEKYESNAWVYRYVEGNEYKVMDGYFPQAGFNLMTGILLKF